MDKPEVPASAVTPLAQTAEIQQNPNKVEVTHDNSDLLAVHFLAQIFHRLGYIVKLLEEKK